MSGYFPDNSAGGLSGSLQFNSAGYMSGSPALSVDLSGNLTITALTGTQSYVVPTSGTVSLFARSKAGRVLIGLVGPAAADTPFQPMLGMNRVGWSSAQGGAATITTVGMSAPTVTGALAAATWASTNFSSSAQRVNIIPAGALGAGTSAGYYSPQAVWWLSNIAGAGGFYMVHRGIIATFNTGSNTRLFFGMASSTAAPPNGDPSVINLNFFGVGKDVADANYFFMHNAGTSPAVKINTNIPCTQGDVIEVRVYGKPGMAGVSGSIGMSLEVLSVSGTGSPGAANTFAEFINSASTNFPAATTPLGWRTYMQTATGTIRYGWMSQYIEVDE